MASDRGSPGGGRSSGRSRVPRLAPRRCSSQRVARPRTRWPSARPRRHRRRSPRSGSAGRSTPICATASGFDAVNTGGSSPGGYEAYYESTAPTRAATGAATQSSTRHAATRSPSPRVLDERAPDGDLLVPGERLLAPTTRIRRRRRRRRAHPAAPARATTSAPITVPQARRGRHRRARRPGARRTPRWARRG